VVAEAKKYKVLLLDGSVHVRLATVRPQTSKLRTRFVYYPGHSVVPAFAAPQLYNRPHAIEADVAGGAEERLTPGRHALRYEFEPMGEPDIANGKGVPDAGSCRIDGRLVANTDYPHTTPLFFELDGVSCGFEFGAPAAEVYEPPFPFTGTIRSGLDRPRRRADRRRRVHGPVADGAAMKRGETQDATTA
jgi:arylsulfatase